MNKKVFLLVIAAVALLLPAAVQAVSKSDIMAKLAPNLTIVSEGMNIDTSTDTPLIYEGKTYLPVRKVAESLGYDVTWNAAASRVDLIPTTDGAEGIVNIPHVELLSITGNAEDNEYYKNRAIYRVKFVVNVKEDIGRALSVKIEVINKDNKIVASNVDSFAKTGIAGTYNGRIDSGFFSVNTDHLTSRAEVVDFVAEQYSYRVTIK